MEIKESTGNPINMGKTEFWALFFRLIELLKLFPWGKPTENKIKLEISDFFVIA